MELLLSPSSKPEFQPTKLEFSKSTAIIFLELFQTPMANREVQYLRKEFFTKEILSTKGPMVRVRKKQEIIFFQARMKTGWRSMANYNGIYRIQSFHSLMKEILRTICFMGMEHWLIAKGSIWEILRKEWRVDMGSWPTPMGKSTKEILTTTRRTDKENYMMRQGTL